ncbi:MAG: 7TM-DISM domain-containing protein, partial [Leptospiraceae bacterium]|nr:7TM-DISM domain-containing protein [Leptospiraceae bacterium]
DRRLQGMDIWKRLDYAARGYATYRTLIHLPANRPLMLRFSQQLTAVRIYTDGKESAGHGIPGRSMDTTVPGRKNLLIEVNPSAEPMELVMQVANFHAFRGGARGVIEVGPAEKILESSRLEESLELLAAGFLGAIALYHLFLFSLQRREWVYLCFATLCLSFAFRIPLLGEKTIHLLWPGISWETQYRTNLGLNILTPPLLILFFHLLFPDALRRRLLVVFLIICAIFALSIFLDTIRLGQIMFAYYLVVAGPALLLGLYMVFSHGIRRKGSGRTMALGMGMVSVLGLMAIYQNWYTKEDAGYLAMWAFVAFGLFQAVGVAQRHHESNEKEQELSRRLQKSREALSHQRQSLENDLHDTLGSRLVDLKLLADKDSPDMKSLRSQLNATYDLFRGQLLFMEDLEYSSRDPLTAMQISVLRRYSAAERELRFHIDEAHRPVLEEFLSDDAIRADFLQLTRELCTNDLKYGRGESRWRLSLREATVVLDQFNLVAESGLATSSPSRKNDLASFKEIPAHVDGKHQDKEMARHARIRIWRLGGDATVRTSGRVFLFQGRIPLT